MYYRLVSPRLVTDININYYFKNKFKVGLVKT